MKCKILPSLLAADPGHLARGAKLAESSGADELHLDIMDGHFVPNISMGPDVVAMCRRECRLPLNVHLMLTHPDQYVDAFHKAGTDTLYIHIESECDVPATLNRIKDLGMKPGITLNPETPAARVFPVLDSVDAILVMTVHPGYGGQSFMGETLPLIRAVYEESTRRGRADMEIMVDGGINGETGPQCAKAGANAFVAGTYLYGADDMAVTLQQLRQAVTAAHGELTGKEEPSDS